MPIFSQVSDKYKIHDQYLICCVRINTDDRQLFPVHMELPIYFIALLVNRYKNWQDYLKNNTLPNCIFCYPKNDVYSAVNGVVEVEYGISPAGKIGKKILRDLDFGYRVRCVLRQYLDLQHCVFQWHCQLLQV
jgi:hypothetical protein